MPDEEQEQEEQEEAQDGELHDEGAGPDDSDPTVETPAPA